MKHKRYTTERERNFEQLLDRYKLALNARCVFWFGGNAEKAKDAYQDILTMLWLQMDSWRPDMSRKEESLWVLNVARRVLRSNYGKKKYKEVFCNDVEVFEKNMNIVVCNRELIDELKTQLDDGGPHGGGEHSARIYYKRYGNDVWHRAKSHGETEAPCRTKTDGKIQ